MYRGALRSILSELLRQERLIRKALAACCDVEVLGAVPRDAEVALPSRHLGLVTASEHEHSQQALDKVAALIADNVDLQAVLRLAQTAVPLTFDSQEPLHSHSAAKMAVFRDRAFSFYYPENLEALEAAGARLVFVSPLTDGPLPPVDALYIGGGFPDIFRAVAHNEHTVFGLEFGGGGEGMGEEGKASDLVQDLRHVG